MSLWLKRQQPIQLYQSSELPYVILEDGVHLCFDNCYGTQNSSDDNLCFQIEASKLSRINTYFYKIEKFPVIIPFSDVVFLNDAVIEGRIIKHASAVIPESKTIAIVKSSYIRSCSDLSDFHDNLEEFDASFILVGDNIDPQTRLFESVSVIIPHQKWPRTIVSIADRICERKDRKYCWSQSVADLSIFCYGIDNADEINEVHNSFEIIGIDDVSVRWAD